MSRTFLWNQETEPADGSVSAGTVVMWLDTGTNIVKYKDPNDLIRLLGVVSGAAFPNVNVAWVDINHPDGGDGSAGSPFNKVQAGIDFAKTQTPSLANPWVVFAYPGKYVEDITLTGFVSVIGFARENTTIDNTAAISLDGFGELVLRDLKILGPVSIDTTGFAGSTVFDISRCNFFDTFIYAGRGAGSDIVNWDEIIFTDTFTVSGVTAQIREVDFLGDVNYNSGGSVADGNGDLANFFINDTFTRNATLIQAEDGEKTLYRQVGGTNAAVTADAGAGSVLFIQFDVVSYPISIVKIGTPAVLSSALVVDNIIQIHNASQVTTIQLAANSASISAGTDEPLDLDAQVDCRSNDKYFMTNRITTTVEDGLTIPDGAIWYNKTLGVHRARQDGVTRNIPATNNYYQSFDSGGVTNVNNPIPVPVPFDTVEASQPWITETSDSLKTINADGVYIIAYSIGISHPNAGSVSLEFDLFIDNLISSKFRADGEIEATEFRSYPSVGRSIELNAGQTIEVRGFNVGGVNNATVVQATTTRLTIIRIK